MKSKSFPYFWSLTSGKQGMAHLQALYKQLEPCARSGTFIRRQQIRESVADEIQAQFVCDWIGKK
jgi:hypothetical protein